MWKTRAVPRDGEPFAPSNRAPPSKPRELLGISATKVDKVTPERTKIPSGYSVGICPLRRK